MTSPNLKALRRRASPHEIEPQLRRAKFAGNTPPLQIAIQVALTLEKKLESYSCLEYAATSRMCRAHQHVGISCVLGVFAHYRHNFDRHKHTSNSKQFDSYQSFTQFTQNLHRRRQKASGSTRDVQLKPLQLSRTSVTNPVEAKRSEQ